MALILEEIAIDNEVRVSMRRTREDLRKAEDLHKSALDLARYTYMLITILILFRYIFISVFLISLRLPHSPKF